MSGLPPVGPARPARLAGFILIGVAIVAVGLGVFALTGNGASKTTATGPTTTTTTAPGSTTTGAPRTTTKPGSTTTAPPTTTYPSGQTTTVAPPPGAATSGSNSANPATEVRVYNNSTIKNLAAIAGGQFTHAGFDVVETGNYSAGIIPTSTVYYTPTIAGQQAVATQLANDFGMRVQPRFPGIATASPGIIVIVTKDFRGLNNGGTGNGS